MSKLEYHNYKAQEVLRWISTSLVNLDSELGLESESQVFDLFLVDIGFGFDIVLENWNFILFKPYSKYNLVHIYLQFSNRGLMHWTWIVVLEIIMRLELFSIFCALKF